MARPTRNRRTTKHRGNAAGMIEARGRTGRKPTASEKKKAGASRPGARPASTRRSRYDKPPTWRGAAVRAVIAAALVYLALVLLVKHASATRDLVLLPIVLALYMPLIYYTDRYLYRRQQRKQTGR